MTNKLSGKVAVVTGAASGIGRAASRHLADAGARPILVDQKAIPRSGALTIMADPAGATFIDIPKVFTDNKYAKQKLGYVTDQTVQDFWNKEMASTSDYHKS